MTATPTSELAATINPLAKTIRGTMGTWQMPLKNGGDYLRMIPLVLTANTGLGWQYRFAQTITSVAVQTVPAAVGGPNGAGVWVSQPPISGLDTQFPMIYKLQGKSHTALFVPTANGQACSAWTFDFARAP